MRSRKGWTRILLGRWSEGTARSRPLFEGPRCWPERRGGLSETLIFRAAVSKTTRNSIARRFVTANWRHIDTIDATLVNGIPRIHFVSPRQNLGARADPSDLGRDLARQLFSAVAGAASPQSPRVGVGKPSRTRRTCGTCGWLRPTPSIGEARKNRTMDARGWRQADDTLYETTNRLDRRRASVETRLLWQREA